MESRLRTFFIAVAVFMLTFGADNLLAQEPEPVFHLSFEKGLTPVSREEMKGEWQGKSPPRRDLSARRLWWVMKTTRMPDSKLRRS